MELEEVQIQEQQPETQQPDPPSKRKVLYDAVSKKYNLGTFEEFETKLKDPSKRKAFYDGIGKEYNLGTYDEFEAKVNEPLKKKENSLPNGNVPLQSGGGDGTEIPEVSLEPTEQRNPIDLAEEHNKLKNAVIAPSEFESGMSQGTSTTKPDEKSIKQSEDLKDFMLNQYDINPEELYKEQKDFPKEAHDWTNSNGEKPFSKENLVNLREKDKVKYNDIINGVKNQYEIAKANGDWGKANEYVGLQTAGDYTELADNILKQQDIINTSFPTQEEKETAQQRLQQGQAYRINPSTKGFMDVYNNSPLKDKVDPNQFAGLETLRIFDPEKYKVYVGALQENITPQWNVEYNISPEEKVKNVTTDSALAKKMGGTISSLTTNQRIGKEQVLRDLSNIGSTNEYDNLSSEQTVLQDKAKEATTPEEFNLIKNQFDLNQQKIEDLRKTELLNDSRYPLTAKLKYDAQVKEMLQDRGIGVGGYMYNRYAHGLSSSVDAVTNLVTSIFGSESDKNKLRLKSIGENKQYEQSIYLPENDRRVNSDFTLQIDDSLKKEANKILKGRDLSDLSDEEKNKLNTLVANNQDKINTVTNPNSGKSKNFFSKATGLSVAGFTADIGAFLTKMGLLQGVGLGAKAAEATTLFTDGYDAAYNKKLSEGASTDAANEYGILHGAILSLMAKFGSKYETIMNVVKGGESPISKMIAGMSEETWNKLAGETKPLLSKIGKTLVGVGKEQSKMIGTFGIAAPTLSSLADNAFYEDNKSVGQMAKEAFENSKEMLIGSAGFIGLGLAKGVMKENASPLEKSVLWEMGDNPEIGKSKIDDAVKNLEITPEQGEKYKSIIDNVSKLIEQVPEKNDKGKPLNDKQRTNYLYNLALKDNLKSRAKSLPEKQSDKLTQQALVIDKENSIALEGLTDNQLTSRKEQIQKTIDKKDENGKPELNEKEMLDAKAELQAIDNHLEKNKGPEVKGEPEQITQPTELSVEPVSKKVEEGSGIVGGEGLKKMSDADIENKMAGIEDGKGDKSEFNTLEKEMEKRERSTVFDVPLENVNDSVDALMKKEKEKPNGYGAFIEKRDARETKEVADRYLKANELTDAELKEDFSDAVRGNPTTWYADGLKLRESLKEATKRGIDTEKMLSEVTKVYTNEGYDIETAKSVVANMLKPVFEGSQKVETDKSKILEKQSSPQQEGKEVSNVSEPINNDEITSLLNTSLDRYRKSNPKEQQKLIERVKENNNHIEGVLSDLKGKDGTFTDDKGNSFTTKNYKNQLEAGKQFLSKVKQPSPPSTTVEGKEQLNEKTEAPKVPIPTEKEGTTNQSTDKVEPTAEEGKPKSKGFYAEVYEPQLNGTPEQREQALKDISDQWHDKGSRKTLEQQIAPEIIEEAKKKFPQQETEGLSVLMEEGEGKKEVKLSELDKLANNVPDSGKVSEYMSKGTIEKYTGETPTNDQSRGVQELEIALNHGEKIIEKAKEIFGESYVEPTLDYIEKSNSGISNKALMYVSLENALSKEKIVNPEKLSELTKLQALVYEQSQKFARENSLALNYQKLRRISKVGYDINKVTDALFSDVEIEAKNELNKAIEADADMVNKEAERLEVGGITADVEKLINEGVENEINKIYESLPEIRKTKADKLIKALDEVQKKLRSRNYDATLGIPVAVVDFGITVIKRAIKLGATVEQAVEAAIKRMKEKLGEEKEWEGEERFRKDTIEEFKKYAPDVKNLVKESLIKNGFGRTVKSKGEEKQILDWKKLAGRAGTVSEISKNVADVFLKEGKSKAEVETIKESLVKEYINLRASIIEKAQNEIAKRNKEVLTSNQKSAAKKLAELYTYGLFEQKLSDFENLTNKALGTKVSEQGFKDAKEIAHAMELIYANSFKGIRLNDISAKAALERLEDKMRVLLFRESKKQGNWTYKAANLVRNYFEVQQTMLLNNLKQAFENPLSGIQQKVIENINSIASGSTKELSAQNRKIMNSVYKDMVLKGGTGYGKVESQFVNRQHIDDYINKLSDNELYHGVTSVITGKATLNAIDAMMKAGITEKKFTHNLLKVLTHETNPQKMSKDTALKFVSKKLTGQSFVDAQKTAKTIINKINSDAGKKLIEDNAEMIDRFANDIVKSSLEMGNKITSEQIEAAYNAAYKGAGLGLGHEANNILSATIKGYSARIEGEINAALKNKEWNRAAALTMKGVLFRNILNPFVGGGTNWLMLKLEKTGLGLFTGLAYKIGAKRDIDLSTKSGLTKLEQRLYNQTRWKDNVMRGAIGGAVTWSSYALALSLMNTDEYADWRKKNKWASRYLDVITPESLLARMALKNGDEKSFRQYVGQSFNRNDAFSAEEKFMKGVGSYLKEDNNKAWGYFGEMVGSKANAPLPWRLFKDGQVLYQGITGQDPYHGDYKPSNGFLNGYFRGGVIEWLGARPEPNETEKQNKKNKPEKPKKPQKK